MIGSGENNMYSSILLTGGSGLLGRELRKIASNPDSNIEYVAPSSKELNITIPENIDKFVEKNVEWLSDLTTLVHCAAWTDVPGAEIQKEKVIESNIIGTKYMRQLCKNFNYRFVYISTDYVYPGINGNYKETDLTHPINFYSFTKLAGEAYVNRPDYGDLIIRTSFKPSKWEFTKAFDDIYTSADYIDIIAKKISFLIEHRAEGIYNVGTERKSIYELALRRNTTVLPMSRKDITNVNLPQDVSMNLDKYNMFYNNPVED